MPSNFHEVLIEYTKKGYRVLALAHRSLPAKLKYAKIQRIQRYRFPGSIYLIYQLNFHMVKNFPSSKCSYSETLKIPVLIVPEESKWRGTWPSWGSWCSRTDWSQRPLLSFTNSWRLTSELSWSQVCSSKNTVSWNGTDTYHCCSFDCIEGRDIGKLNVF